jgi:hypothetical protein
LIFKTDIQTGKTLSMIYQSGSGDEIKIARVCVVVIFFALIRSLSEIFRLQYYLPVGFNYEQVEPFIIGGLVISTALLIMIIFYFYSKYKIVIMVSVLTIIAMLAIKKLYLL